MLLIKITVFLIILTIIYRFVVQSLIDQEDTETKVAMVFSRKYPAYVWVFIIMVLVCAIGFVCSLFWILFMR